MALKESNNGGGKSINVAYSALAGGLVIKSDEQAAAFAKIKGVLAEDKNKGMSPKDTNNFARKSLKEEGIPLYSELSGKLVSAFIKAQKDQDGKEFKYLKVNLRDEDGTAQWLSMAIENEAAQMIARKIINAEIGKEIVISPFATHTAKTIDGVEKTFVNHGASVKQEGEELPAGLSDRIHDIRVNTAETLKAADVTDSKTISTAIEGKIVKVIESGMTEFSEKTAAFYDARRTQSESAAVAAAPAGAAAKIPDPDAKSASAAKNAPADDIDF